MNRRYANRRGSDKRTNEREASSRWAAARPTKRSFEKIINRLGVN